MTRVYPTDSKECHNCDWLVELIGDPDYDDELEIYECGNKEECTIYKKAHPAIGPCPACGGDLKEYKEHDGTISVMCSSCTYPVCSIVR